MFAESGSIPFPLTPAFPAPSLLSFLFHNSPVPIPLPPCARPSYLPIPPTPPSPFLSPHSPPPLPAPTPPPPPQKALYSLPSHLPTPNLCPSAGVCMGVILPSHCTYTDTQARRVPEAPRKQQHFGPSVDCFLETSGESDGCLCFHALHPSTVPAGPTVSCC